ncbi:MAG: uroporphyrinogen decarboxylase [Nitrospiraceae bacterium]|nr:uroporphyrinogen decarboxylase [Nitrospiraceae bacterium]
MNEAFLRACRGEATRPVPVWLMRQAAAYQAIREKIDFLTLCKTPELAAEVSLQPVDILGVDAAILFSDILIPVEAMGMGLDFQEGEGPVLDPPIRTERDLKRLRAIDPAVDVPFVLETVRILKKELSNRVPLIGFSGAPFTLAAYMIEGGTSRSFVNIKRMMFESLSLFSHLMNLITKVTISYLQAQIKAGVQVIQLFDTWAGILAREDYNLYALPYVSCIFKTLKGLGVPGIYFVYDGGHLLESMSGTGADVIGLDWRTDIETAIPRLGTDITVQGNLDPCDLFLPEDRLRTKIDSVLRQGRKAGAHIFNLGHGIPPEIPYEKARLMVDLVHELSA